MSETIQRKLNDSPVARWTALLLIASTMFFGYMFVDLMSPLQSMIEAQRGWTPDVFGMYGSSEFILNVFGFLILAGIILDKMGVRFTGQLSASLMFIGACAGSTGGGIKVSRILILLKTVKKELGSIVHPRSIKRIRFDDHPVEHEVLRAINVFLIVYLVIYSFSMLIISVDGFSFETNFTAVAATLNNIGPGLDLVGPTSNFFGYGPVSKLILIFDMLAGRLELFPMLILFYPSTWKKRG